MKLQISDTTQLRPLRRSDAEELHGLIAVNRARLTPWLAWAAQQTAEDTLQFLSEAENQQARGDGAQLGVVSEGRIAGVVGCVNFNRPYGSTNLGYWLGSEHEGRGTMTAAVRALVDHAFSAWDLHRVEIRAATENHRSRAIPERLGFHQEGTLRQVEFVGGRFLDSVVYSMLAPEWR